MPQVTAVLANRLISCPTPQAKLVSRPALNQNDYSRPYSQVVKINTPFLQYQSQNMPLLCRNSISYLVFTHLKNCHKYFFINNRNAHNWLLDCTLKKHYLRILTLVMNIAAFYSLLRKVFNCKQAKCKYHTNSAPFRSSHYCILPTTQDHLHQDC